MVQVHATKKTSIVAVFVLVSLFGIADARWHQFDETGSKAFDVTQFGASPGGDDDSSKAFLDAWEAACNFNGKATLVIPDGTFMLKSVEFKGPCSNGGSPAVMLVGTLKASSGSDDSEDKCWIVFRDLNTLNLSGSGTLDGQGSESWNINQCHKNPRCKLPAIMLKLEGVSNSTVDGLNLVNSKSFHLNLENSQNINVLNLNIIAPEDSPNTDGIHLAKSSYITINNSVIGTGDDCISIGEGTSHVIVYNITCGPGHGISVGSLGKYPDEKDVSDVLVTNCTINNTSNGVRIKTWPGSPLSRAHNFTFEDINMIDVENPIVIDQDYCPVHKECSDKPSNVKISNVKYRRIQGTSKTKVAVKLTCSENAPCEDVELQDIDLVYSDDKGETSSSCSYVKGTFSGGQIPPPCVSQG